ADASRVAAAGTAAAQSAGPLTGVMDDLLVHRMAGLSRQRDLTLAITMVGLLLAVWLAVAVIWRTRRDVATTVRAASAIQQGDLRPQVIPAGRDEFGDVGRAISAARERMQSLLGIIADNLTSLQDASAGPSGVSQGLASSAQ